MTYQHISLKTDNNNIIWLSIDVKGEAANVINPELVKELSNACDEIKTSNAKGLIICSEKPSGFIAGADVKSFQDIPAGEEGQKLALKFIHMGQAMCQKIEDLPIPTLAMVKMSVPPQSHTTKKTYPKMTLEA